MLCVLAARTSAAFIKQGMPDPFSGVEQITPELLGKLGVTTAEIQDCLQASHRNSVMDPIRRAFRVRVWHPLLNFTRPIRHALGLRQKSVKATDKQKVLLRNGLRDATWVETGTFMGDTTSVLSRVARMVYSIEPEPALFSKAEQKFRNTSNVKIIKGLSEDVFPKLLPTISGNVCFWLDGHYSAGITFKGPQETPILDELAAVGRYIAQMNKIVVLVDDVRCFDPSNPEFSAYPPVDVLVDWARKYNLTWYIELIVVDDGSTDERTRKEMEALSTQGINVVRQENKGLAAARNAGVLASQGEYIFPLDADDRMRGGWLARAVGILESDLQIGVVYGDGQNFGTRSDRW